MEHRFLFSKNVIYAPGIIKVVWKYLDYGKRTPFSSLFTESQDKCAQNKKLVHEHMVIESESSILVACMFRHSRYITPFAINSSSKK